MKGAIGSAVILNIVITFITLFLLLLVGAMAYTKTVKVRNYLLVETEKFYENNGKIPFFQSSEIKKWDEIVNPYLARAGYPLSQKRKSCPYKDNYEVRVDTRVGFYEYCIYQRVEPGTKGNIDSYTTFMVLAYMKMDIPVVGQFMKIPITGETKPFIKLK